MGNYYTVAEKFTTIQEANDNFETMLDSLFLFGLVDGEVIDEANGSAVAKWGEENDGDFEDLSASEVFSSLETDEARGQYMELWKLTLRELIFKYGFNGFPDFSGFPGNSFEALSALEFSMWKFDILSDEEAEAIRYELMDRWIPRFGNLTDEEREDLQFSEFWDHIEENDVATETQLLNDWRELVREKLNSQITG